MNAIRPFRHDDAPAVAALYERVLRSRTDAPPPLLAPAFVHYFLDCPGADPEIPSLVCEDSGGRLVGFIGSTVRRLVFDGMPIRLGCSGPLLRSPEGAGMAAVQLLKAYLAGPQDLSITDGATPDAAKLWVGIGGRQAHVPSLDWIKFLRPARFAMAYGLGRLDMTGLEPVGRVLGGPVDALVGRWFGAPRPEGTLSEDLTADTLAELAGEEMGWARLRPVYDRSLADWLFTEMGAIPSRGPLSRRLVRDRSGRPLGWHVAFVPPGGTAEVMQVVAKPRMVGAVLDDLFHHVRERDGAAVRGRLEPPLFDALTHRGVHIRPGYPALVHSRRRDILAALALGEAVLTRMDGEWWLPLHTERYGAPAVSRTRAPGALLLAAARKGLASVRSLGGGRAARRAPNASSGTEP